MRGTPCNFPETSVAPEIIPAYAGNTLWSMHASPSCGDHPRVCGEHHIVSTVSMPLPGSSPRMRGTHLREHGARHHEGIIPAYAGNTCRCRTVRQSSGDHPRVCGEHVRSGGRRMDRRGSSPRMRGTPNRTRCAARRSGIIPAYAGNTLLPWYPFGERGDHPRVCGEHYDPTRHGFTSVGSSPRMRGTLTKLLGKGATRRIIPAYAGNTKSLRLWSRAARDHPRVCGEHPMLLAILLVLPGSSPRMRGTLDVCRRPGM